MAAKTRSKSRTTDPLQNIFQDVSRGRPANFQDFAAFAERDIQKPGFWEAAALAIEALPKKMRFYAAKEVFEKTQDPSVREQALKKALVSIEFLPKYIHYNMAFSLGRHLDGLPAMKKAFESIGFLRPYERYIAAMNIYRSSSPKLFQAFGETVLEKAFAYIEDRGPSDRALSALEIYKATNSDTLKALAKDKMISSLALVPADKRFDTAIRIYEGVHDPVTMHQALQIAFASIDHQSPKKHYASAMAVYRNTKDQELIKAALEKAFASIGALPKNEHYDCALEIYRHADDKDPIKASAWTLAFNSIDFLPDGRLDRILNLYTETLDADQSAQLLSKYIAALQELPESEAHDIASKIYRHTIDAALKRALAGHYAVTAEQKSDSMEPTEFVTAMRALQPMPT